MDTLVCAQITVSYTTDGIKFYGGVGGYDFGCQLFVFGHIVNAMWTPVMKGEVEAKDRKCM